MVLGQEFLTGIDRYLLERVIQIENIILRTKKECRKRQESGLFKVVFGQVILYVSQFRHIV